MYKKKHLSELICFKRAMLKSGAFKKLRGNSVKVLLYFLARRIFRKVRAHKNDTWEQTNNGEIVFPYEEAVSLGFSRGGFANALDQLIETGFVDIAQRGDPQIRGRCTMYSISDRWKCYGKSDFKEASRGKDYRCATWKKRKVRHLKVISDSKEKGDKAPSPSGAVRNKSAKRPPGPEEERRAAIEDMGRTAKAIEKEQTAGAY